MAAFSEPPDKKNAYVLDAESSAEMARLMRQEQLITSGMGGVFPELINLDNVEHVLDLGCGPGGWALEVAYRYSDMQVVGVDISERMIRYANAQAEVQHRTNASFQVMDVTAPLAFPARSFDLVNTRLISTFMVKDKWLPMFAECLRILRPGGSLRVTEVSLGMSNKPYFEQCFQMGLRVLHRAGMSFSPSGMYHATVQMLPSFFRRSGFAIQGKMAHFIEFSAGTEAQESFFKDCLAMFQLIEPLVVNMQFATAESWRSTYQKGLAEMYEEDFCAAWMLLTVWGKKPG